jgi:hypothetical protein
VLGFRIQADERRELLQTRFFLGMQPAHVIPLQDVPVVVAQRLAQER